MANHYLLVGVASRDWDRINALPKPLDYYIAERIEFDGYLLRDEVADLEKSVGEFGCYSVKISDAEGDMAPKIIQIECRWKAPDSQHLGLITRWLRNSFFLKAIQWLGHNPSDCEVDHLKQEELTA